METTRLKPFFILAFLLVGQLMLVACMTGENEDPVKEGEFFLKFKVKGIEKRYEALPNSMASFYYLDEAGIYGSSITGLKDIGDASKDLVTIQLFNETLYEPNRTYDLQEGLTAGAVLRGRIIFTYFDENGKGYNALLLKERYPNLNVTDEAEVRFTEMAADYVKGTFSARVNEVEFVTQHSKEELLITEGEFYLPRMDASGYR